jgi:general secretion pathway protein A
MFAAELFIYSALTGARLVLYSQACCYTSVKGIIRIQIATIENITFMYHTFFNLTEPAFSIAVNPRYLYMSQQHKEALAHLLYGVSGGGFIMLTGEVGMGKTTIIRCLLEQMPENTDVAIVMNPMSNVPELLSIICDELEASYIDDEPTLKELTDALHAYLLKSHTQGRNTILLIDEAQLLSVEALEHIRLLTNLETNTQKLLHIILVGQPELKTLIAQPQLRQLTQRITARFHLAPLTLNETQNYIHHRLKVAGMRNRNSPFPTLIIKKIHSLTGGIPRLINVICERCLIGAYASNTQTVDLKIFNVARKEVTGELTRGKRDNIKYYIAAACVVVGILLLTGLFFSTKKPPKTKVAVTASSSIAATKTPASESMSTSSQAVTDTSDVKPEQSQANTSLINANIRNYKAAENILFTYLGLPIAAETRPCGASTKNAQQCTKKSLHTWTEVGEINRPAIIVLATPEKFSTYVVMIGIHQDKAQVLDEQGQKVTLSLANLGTMWTGDIVYLWNKPKDYSEPLTLGDSSSTIEWVAQQFAKLDKQIDPLTDDLFNIALQERVKIFQRAKGIHPDGTINQQTLMEINAALNIDKTLLTEF